MSSVRNRVEGGIGALTERAVRVPLGDAAAERAHYENMQRIAAETDRMADLLADPDVPAAAAMESAVEAMVEGFEHRIQRVAGASVEAVASAYLDGERDDWVGELAVYYRECQFRIQEHATVDDQLCLLVLLRYPDCVTVNFAFAVGDLPGDGVRFESPMHSSVPLDDDYREQYYADSRREQREAADYLRAGADVVRDAFPDPDEIANPEPGGYAFLTGRRDGSFAVVLERIDPDPTRFDAPATDPAIVPQGPEAARVQQRLLGDAERIA